MFTSLEEFTMSNAIDPTKFWPQILESISDGQSLSSAINRKGFPSYSWCKSALRQNPELRRHYEQAVLARCDRLADELLELADQPMPKGLEAHSQSAWVQQLRLQIDARKWTMSKLAPRFYGDRLSVDVENTGTSITAVLAAARERVKTSSNFLADQ